MRTRDISLSLFTFALLTASAAAQYQPYVSEDFESTGGNWPSKLVHGHNSSPITTQIVEFNQDDFPPGLYIGRAPKIVKKYGLRFQPIADDPHLSIVSKTSLNREKLGADAAAMIEGDFFFGEESAVTPTIAILASSADHESGGGKGYRFYRFGIDRNRVYFSFTFDKAEPVIYLRQNLSEFDIQRGAWHRFQMIFKGQDQIICAIDGQQTSFSPITDATMIRVDPGMMVTRSKEGDGTIYADNLAILWAPAGADQTPTSPWVATATGAPVRRTAGNPWNSDVVNWLTSPGEAWKAATAQNKVMFALFHDDQPGPNAKLQALIATPEAGAVIGQCIPLRVNIADAAGAKIAASYQVDTAPTIVVIGADGKAQSRVVIDTAADLVWADIYNKLRSR